ncbi:hypothetical protein OVA06_12955 [Pseudarthrobacter sp. SL88]|uniref:hypothetical protein n=1 Tax=Pseudarthrobacter sp. SL88 TaxID=2994666 RepID=UPI00227687CC|nr:hypothetical protein [Pseudarthrobacter sp. SL88]MCY1675604.1 hypothetical protein [Pseudarthrobacter sp. SL88]
MIHNKNNAGRWFALLAASVFVLGLGTVIGYMGFRVDSGALGNFFGVTPHQWGVLLSGLFGSLAGGAVAVWVLGRTLEHQEATHQRQLDHSQQLHYGQLAAQKAEAARQRASAAAAAVMSGLWLMNRGAEDSLSKFKNQVDSILVGINGLYLESEHKRLAAALLDFIAEFDDTTEEILADANIRLKLERVTGTVNGAVAAWFQQDNIETHEWALRRITAAREEATTLIPDNDDR